MAGPKCEIYSRRHVSSVFFKKFRTRWKRPEMTLLLIRLICIAALAAVGGITFESTSFFFHVRPDALRKQVAAQCPTRSSTNEQRHTTNKLITPLAGEY